MAIPAVCSVGRTDNSFVWKYSIEGCFGCSPWNNLKIRSGASVRSAIFLMIITSKYPSETDARGAASAKPPTLFEFATKNNMISSVPKDKKAVLGKMAYYLEGVKEFPKQLSQNMTLTFNSKEYSGTEDIMLFLVANSKSVGGFADAAPLASVSDGYLDVMIIKKMALLTVKC